MIVHKNKFLALWIIAALGSIPLAVFKLYEYLIVTGIIFAFTFIFWLIGTINSKDENKVYDSYLKEILKTFDSVLIKVTTIPDLGNRNIINVSSIENLIDAQVELRKPIYYYMDINSCTFMLLDDKEICLFVLRRNKYVIALIDGILHEEENQKRIKKESDKKALENYNRDSSILDNIENTTIIKFNNRQFRVSPIRNIEMPKLSEAGETNEKTY